MMGFGAPPPQIRALTSNPGELSRFGAVALGGDEVLVVARHLLGAWVLDARAGHWQPCTLPEAMSIDLCLPSGHVLCEGPSGYWLFRPVSRTWQRPLRMPDVKQGITFRMEGEVLLIGGFGPDSDHSWRGNPLTGEWRPFAPMPLARWGASAVTAKVGDTAEHGPAGVRVFVAGFNNRPSREQNERLDVYDPARDRWTALSCPEAIGMGRDGPGLPTFSRKVVTSIWGVVAHVVVFGDRLYAEVAERRHHPDSWSVGARGRQAVLDLAALQWLPSLAMPRGALTGQFPGTTVGLGWLLSPAYDGLWYSDGSEWGHVPWPEGGDGHPAAVHLDDGRVVVIGRTRSWTVTR